VLHIYSGASGYGECIQADKLANQIAGSILSEYYSYFITKSLLNTIKKKFSRQLTLWEMGMQEKAIHGFTYIMQRKISWNDEGKTVSQQHH
jgi:hypothetical protein